MSQEAVEYIGIFHRSARLAAGLARLSQAALPLNNHEMLVAEEEVFMLCFQGLRTDRPDPQDVRCGSSADFAASWRSVLATLAFHEA